MKKNETITVMSDKKEVELNVRDIIYIMMNGDFAYIHHAGEGVFRTKTPLVEIEKKLGDSMEYFIKIKRGCLVSVFAIHNITDKVNLGNGEELDYVPRGRERIIQQFQEKQKEYINDLDDDAVPKTAEEYHEWYRVFDNLPIAFTDIEMVFDETCCAVDWVFRYGNPALAELERMPLEKMI